MFPLKQWQHFAASDCTTSDIYTWFVHEKLKFSLLQAKADMWQKCTGDPLINGMACLKHGECYSLSSISTLLIIDTVNSTFFIKDIVNTGSLMTPYL